ncbi:unnamed protein product [Absidia cylindrospora]
MKLSLIIFSAVILGVHQVIAAPASVSKSISSSVKAAVPGVTSSLVAPTMLPEGAITLDSPLVQELGWSQNDIDILTGFLNAIDRLGDLTGQQFDPATQQLLSDFQAEARELIANAGYKYQLSKADNMNTNGILSRILVEDAVGTIIYKPKGLPEVVDGLVKALEQLLEKLQKKADDGSILSEKLLTFINNLLTSLGKQIEDHLFPKSKPASPASKLSLNSPTFLH